MHISINTAEEISDLDRQVLSLLAGGVSLPVEGTSAPEPEPEKPSPKKRAPKKKAEPDPEPEPMAEEPLPEDEEPEDEEPEEEPEDEDADDMSDEDLLALAVKKATEMVSNGEAETVRKALDAAGANRVRELNNDNVREFFRALG